MLVRSLLFLFIMFGSCTYSMAQFGVSGIYNFHQGADVWDNEINSNAEHIKSDGFGVSLNYWFRLKDYRVEFLPELMYLAGNRSAALLDDTPIDHEWQQLALYFNVNIYPFDFEGDCNCPTFGKDGGFFEKGFFFQLSPGAGYYINETKSSEARESSGVAFLSGIGAGLDVGVAEYFTITPFVRYVIGFNTEWPQSDPTNADEGNSIQSSTRDFLAGLNVIYRFDYKKRRF
ncbi:MAG: hypothetical protein R3275_05210 [Saprospiraceae bacterium]|nr:hypothetical protein [Saprospiraceae bacterium]